MDIMNKIRWYDLLIIGVLSLTLLIYNICYEPIIYAHCPDGTIENITDNTTTVCNGMGIIQRNNDGEVIGVLYGKQLRFQKSMENMKWQ